MLDDILTLFRRLRVPARRTGPAGNNRLSINLDSIGGPIYRTRGDSMPQVEPPPRRARPRPEPPREPRAEHQTHQPYAREERAEPQPLPAQQPQPQPRNASGRQQSRVNAVKIFGLPP